METPDVSDIRTLRPMPALTLHTIVESDCHIVISDTVPPCATLEYDMLPILLPYTVMLEWPVGLTFAKIVLALAMSYEVASE